MLGIINSSVMVDYGPEQCETDSTSRTAQYATAYSAKRETATRAGDRAGQISGCSGIMRDPKG